jgi:hypothetical protein
VKTTIASLTLVGTTCLSAYAFILGGQMESNLIKNVPLAAFIVAPVVVLGIGSIWLEARELVVVAAIAIGGVKWGQGSNLDKRPRKR